MSKPIDYKEAGVDLEKANRVLGRFSEALKKSGPDPNLLTGIGAFAAAFRLGPSIAKMEDPILVTCCDGVGTKVMLAQSWGNLAGLGQDLVAMNVNDLLCSGALPLVFLDYYACSTIPENDLLTLLDSIRRGCELSGCSLVGGETAEMPGLYKDKDFDLAGFAAGIADRKKMLTPDKVKMGHDVVAIASSGVHSTGYSLVRKIISLEKLSPTDKPEFDSRTWKEILLEPTRLYVKALKPHLENLSALANITGGGLYENLPRVLPSGLSAKIQSALWDIPPLFRWLQEKSHIDEHSLLSTFNCGVGMIAVCPSAYTKTLITEVEYKAWKIGEIVETSASNASVEWV